MTNEKRVKIILSTLKEKIGNLEDFVDGTVCYETDSSSQTILESDIAVIRGLVESLENVIGSGKEEKSSTSEKGYGCEYELPA